ncbi:glutaredoxin family protein [Candidatus Uhrbacteria bacterium]|nr:glutaredoxin family protein [Candidatus Uhrbacteria bacterium]
MNIIMYTKSGCPWCNEVRDLLRERNVDFVERECRGNKTYFEELVQKSGQTLTPTLDIDGEIVADTDAASVERLFKEKGVSGF